MSARSVRDLRAVNRRRKYVRRPGRLVVAVQLALDTSGFEYRKWGGLQTCKPGDWIVDNGGEVYSVDRESFARTYTNVSPGVYRKVSLVWARVADRAGAVRTKEGMTAYAAGAYVVSNDPEGNDSYAMTATAFDAMYEPAD